MSKDVSTQAALGKPIQCFSNFNKIFGSTDLSVIIVTAILRNSINSIVGPNWYKQKELNLKGNGEKSIKFGKLLCQSLT